MAYLSLVELNELNILSSEKYFTKVDKHILCLFKVSNIESKFFEESKIVFLIFFSMKYSEYKVSFVSYGGHNSRYGPSD